MIKRKRLRAILAPTAGLWQVGVLFLVGLAAFVIGAALSFKLVIEPALQSLAKTAGHLLAHLVPSESLELSTHFLGGGLLSLGLYLQFVAVRRGVRHILETVNPGLKSGMVDVYMRRQQLARGPRIVALGGGTGLSTLLRGLKAHSSNITAIVTVSDDGGSSGRLILDKGMIPPGDIRNCLVALADAEKSMTDLFQHRFKDDSGSLSGHSMGNLLIAALVDQAHGDFEKAIAAAADVLAIRGRVLPSTLDHVRLRAVLDDGAEVTGETAMVEASGRIRRVFLDPPDAAPYEPVLEAIRNADLVCIGPGSVYSSIIPNLLVPGMAHALRTASAPKVYICNVMTQPGESDAFTASEHVSAVLLNVEARIFDHVLVNSGIPSESALEKYRDFGQHLVDADIDRIRSVGLRVISGDYVSETDVVRHDPIKVAAKLMRLLNS